MENKEDKDKDNSYLSNNINNNKDNNDFIFKIYFKNFINK